MRLFNENVPYPQPENPHPPPTHRRHQKHYSSKYKKFRHEKERIAISLLESQSVETDIFSNFQQPLCFVL
jgi:hypothetical protein